MIPKFKEVLLVDDLESEKVRDALKTLNELVHHQVSIYKKSSLTQFNYPSSITGNSRQDD